MNTPLYATQSDREPLGSENIRKASARITNTDELPNVYNLIKTAQNGKVQQAEKILQQLKKQSKFDLGAGLCVVLIDMYTKAGMPREAVDTLKEMRQLHPESSVQPSKILELSIMLLQNNEGDECLKVLKRELQLLPESLEEDSKPDDKEAPSALLSKLSHQLVKCAESKRNPQLCEQ